MSFVKYDMNEENYENVKNTLQKMSKTGAKFRAGVNEVTKMIERGKAKLIIMAQDVSPKELLMHIPLLCDDKKIPFTYLKTREDLGDILGLKLKTSCVAMVNEGQAKAELESMVKIISELRK